MKKIDISFVAVVAMFGLVILLWLGLFKDFVDHRPATRDASATWTLEREIEELVAAKQLGKHQQVSKQLSKAIEINPQRVLVCLVITQAHLWPGIGKDDEERVLDLAKVNPSQAIAELKAVMEYMIAEKKIRLGIDFSAKDLSSNAATRVLLIDFPLAQQIGKESLLLRQELEWQPSESRPWYEPELTRKQYLSTRE